MRRWIFPPTPASPIKPFRDTLRVSAVEGTHLTYTLELNKPVARARFVGKDGTLRCRSQCKPTPLPC